MTASPGSPGRRVLLVDDEPDQVELYQYGLQTAGFDVRCAYTGAAAIEAARALLPDIVVLDLRLPDITGWEVCEALRRDPGTASIPVVILTAAASPMLPREAIDSGCAAYLLKPCYPEDLVRTLRAVLDGASSLGVHP